MMILLLDYFVSFPGPSVIGLISINPKISHFELDNDLQKEHGFIEFLHAWAVSSAAVNSGKFLDNIGTLPYA